MQRDQELREHLRIADIILLLVSSDFLKSDLCNQVCVQEALIRYQAGKARILPIILEACEWEYEPFAMLAVLPSNNKPVTVWAREDAALKDITTGIRQGVNDLNRKKDVGGKATTEHKEKQTQHEKSGRRDVICIPQSIDRAVLDNVVNQYFAEYKSNQGAMNDEKSSQTTFQNMFISVAKHIGWLGMIPDKVHIGRV